MNKIHKIIFSVIIVLVCVTIMCCSPLIATKRRAHILDGGTTIFCAISGFVAIPLHPDGPFPEWQNDIFIDLNKGIILPQSGIVQYQASKDFSTRHDEIESGTVIVDQAKKIVKVDFKYNQAYHWQRVNGNFPIIELNKE